MRSSDRRLTSPVRFAVLGGALLLSLGYLAWLFGRMPETVASHFGLDGRPDGWSSRTEFVAVLGLAEVLVTGTFALLLALVLRGAPSWFRLPGNGRWMRPPQEIATRRDLATRLVVLGVASLLWIALLARESRRVSVGLQEELGWFALVSYALFLAAWLLLLWRRYRRVPAAAPTDGA